MVGIPASVAGRATDGVSAQRGCTTADHHRIPTDSSTSPIVEPPSTFLPHGKGKAEGAATRTLVRNVVFLEFDFELV